MRGCRHSGVRIIVPPRKAPMPMRITCRYLRREKLIHPPPLNEGEALASRILEMGPAGAKFLGPVIIEVPHFASLRGREREIVLLRSEDGEHWKEHSLEATEDAVQEVLNESFNPEELSQIEDLNTTRITRILTNDFPQYFALVTRIRQEVHAVGPEGGMIASTVVPQVQALFPEGALTKTIKVSLQAQAVSQEMVTKLHGNRVAVSPIVTVEPRRRKFHKPITLCIPLPQSTNKGMITQYSAQTGQDPPTLRLLCSIVGGTALAQWEDITGTTQLTFSNDNVSFTTTVSARFWLMDCQTPRESARMAQEIYNQAVVVPYMAKFIAFALRSHPTEGQLRLFCVTDDKEEKTLERQEHYKEIAKSRDVEVLSGRTQYLEFVGNLVPMTKSGEQLSMTFVPFQENRLMFILKLREVDDPDAAAVGRVALMREPKQRADTIPAQHPICTLAITLPDYTGPLSFEGGEEFRLPAHRASLIATVKPKPLIHEPEHTMERNAVQAGSFSPTGKVPSQRAHVVTTEGLSEKASKVVQSVSGAEFPSPDLSPTKQETQVVQEYVLEKTPDHLEEAEYLDTLRAERQEWDVSKLAGQPVVAEKLYIKEQPTVVELVEGHEKSASSSPDGGADTAVSAEESELDNRGAAFKSQVKLVAHDRTGQQGEEVTLHFDQGGLQELPSSGENVSSQLVDWRQPAVTTSDSGVITSTTSCSSSTWAELERDSSSDVGRHVSAIQFDLHRDSVPVLEAAGQSLGWTKDDLGGLAAHDSPTRAEQVHLLRRQKELEPLESVYNVQGTEEVSLEPHAPGEWAQQSATTVVESLSTSGSSFVPLQDELVDSVVEIRRSPDSFDADLLVGRRTTTTTTTTGSVGPSESASFGQGRKEPTTIADGAWKSSNAVVLGIFNGHPVVGDVSDQPAAPFHSLRLAADNLVDPLPSDYKAVISECEVYLSTLGWPVVQGIFNNCPVVSSFVEDSQRLQTNSSTCAAPKTFQETETYEEGVIENGKIIATKKVMRVVTTTRTVEKENGSDTSVRVTEQRFDESVPDRTEQIVSGPGPSAEPTNEQPLIRLKVNNAVFNGVLDKDAHIKLTPVEGEPTTGGAGAAQGLSDALSMKIQEMPPLVEEHPPPSWPAAPASSAEEVEKSVSVKERIKRLEGKALGKIGSLFGRKRMSKDDREEAPVPEVSLLAEETLVESVTQQRATVQPLETQSIRSSSSVVDVADLVEPLPDVALIVAKKDVDGTSKGSPVSTLSPDVPESFVFVEQSRDRSPPSPIEVVQSLTQPPVASELETKKYFVPSPAKSGQEALKLSVELPSPPVSVEGSLDSFVEIESELFEGSAVNVEFTKYNERLSKELTLTIAPEIEIVDHHKSASVVSTALSFSPGSMETQETQMLFPQASETHNLAEIRDTSASLEQIVSDFCSTVAPESHADVVVPDTERFAVCELLRFSELEELKRPESLALQDPIRIAESQSRSGLLYKSNDAGWDYPIAAEAGLASSIAKSTFSPVFGYSGTVEGVTRSEVEDKLPTPPELSLRAESLSPRRELSLTLSEICQPVSSLRVELEASPPSPDLHKIAPLELSSFEKAELSGEGVICQASLPPSSEARIEPEELLAQPSESLTFQKDSPLSDKFSEDDLSSTKMEHVHFYEEQILSISREVQGEGEPLPVSEAFKPFDTVEKKQTSKDVVLVEDQSDFEKSVSKPFSAKESFKPDVQGVADSQSPTVAELDKKLSEYFEADSSEGERSPIDYVIPVESHFLPEDGAKVSDSFERVSASSSLELSPPIESLHVRPDQFIPFEVVDRSLSPELADQPIEQKVIFEASLSPSSGAQLQHQEVLIAQSTSAQSKSLEISGPTLESPFDDKISKDFTVSTGHQVDDVSDTVENVKAPTESFELTKDRPEVEKTVSHTLLLQEAFADSVHDVSEKELFIPEKFQFQEPTVAELDQKLSGYFEPEQYTLLKDRADVSCTFERVSASSSLEISSPIVSLHVRPDEFVPFNVEHSPSPELAERQKDDSVICEASLPSSSDAKLQHEEVPIVRSKSAQSKSFEISEPRLELPFGDKFSKDDLGVRKEGQVSSYKLETLSASHHQYAEISDTVKVQASTEDFSQPYVEKISSDIVHLQESSSSTFPDAPSVPGHVFIHEKLEFQKPNVAELDQKSSEYFELEHPTLSNDGAKADDSLEKVSASSSFEMSPPIESLHVRPKQFKFSDVEHSQSPELAEQLMEQNVICEASLSPSCDAQLQHEEVLIAQSKSAQSRTLEISEPRLEPPFGEIFSKDELGDGKEEQIYSYKQKTLSICHQVAEIGDTVEKVEVPAESFELIKDRPEVEKTVSDTVLWQEASIASVRDVPSVSKQGEFSREFQEPSDAEMNQKLSAYFDPEGQALPEARDNASDSFYNLPTSSSVEIAPLVESLRVLPDQFVPFEVDRSHSLELIEQEMVSTFKDSSQEKLSSELEAKSHSPIIVSPDEKDEISSSFQSRDEALASFLDTQLSDQLRKSQLPSSKVAFSPLDQSDTSSKLAEGHASGRGNKESRDEFSFLYSDKDLSPQIEYPTTEPEKDVHRVPEILSKIPSLISASYHEEIVPTAPLARDMHKFEQGLYSPSDIAPTLQTVSHDSVEETEPSSQVWDRSSTRVQEEMGGQSDSSHDLSVEDNLPTPRMHKKSSKASSSSLSSSADLEQKHSDITPMPEKVDAPLTSSECKLTQMSSEFFGFPADEGKISYFIPPVEPDSSESTIRNQTLSVSLTPTQSHDVEVSFSVKHAEKESLVSIEADDKLPGEGVEHDKRYSPSSQDVCAIVEDLDISKAEKYVEICDSSPSSVEEVYVEHSSKVDFEIPDKCTRRSIASFVSSDVEGNVEKLDDNFEEISSTSVEPLTSPTFALETVCYELPDKSENFPSVDFPQGVEREEQEGVEEEVKLEVAKACRVEVTFNCLRAALVESVQVTHFQRDHSVELCQANIQIAEGISAEGPESDTEQGSIAVCEFSPIRGEFSYELEDSPSAEFSSDSSIPYDYSTAAGVTLDQGVMYTDLRGPTNLPEHSIPQSTILLHRPDQMVDMQMPCSHERFGILSPIQGSPMTPPGDEIGQDDRFSISESVSTVRSMGPKESASSRSESSLGPFAYPSTSFTSDSESESTTSTRHKSYSISAQKISTEVYKETVTTQRFDQAKSATVETAKLKLSAQSRESLSSDSVQCIEETIINDEAFPKFTCKEEMFSGERPLFAKETEVKKEVKMSEKVMGAFGSFFKGFGKKDVAVLERSHHQELIQEQSGIAVVVHQEDEEPPVAPEILSLQATGLLDHDVGQEDSKPSPEKSNDGQEFDFKSSSSQATLLHDYHGESCTSERGWVKKTYKVVVEMKKSASDGATAELLENEQMHRAELSARDLLACDEDAIEPEKRTVTFEMPNFMESFEKSPPSSEQMRPLSSAIFLMPIESVDTFVDEVISEASSQLVDEEMSDKVFVIADGTEPHMERLRSFERVQSLSVLPASSAITVAKEEEEEASALDDQKKDLTLHCHVHHGEQQAEIKATFHSPSLEKDIVHLSQTSQWDSSNYAQHDAPLSDVDESTFHGGQTLAECIFPDAEILQYPLPITDEQVRQVDEGNLNFSQVENVADLMAVQPFLIDDVLYDAAEAVEKRFRQDSTEIRRQDKLMSPSSDFPSDQATFQPDDGFEQDLASASFSREHPPPEHHSVQREKGPSPVEDVLSGSAEEESLQPEGSPFTTPMPGEQSPLETVSESSQPVQSECHRVERAFEEKLSPRLSVQEDISLSAVVSLTSRTEEEISHAQHEIADCARVSGNFEQFEQSSSGLKFSETISEGSRSPECEYIVMRQPASGCASHSDVAFSIVDQSYPHSDSRELDTDQGEILIRQRSYSYDAVTSEHAEEKEGELDSCQRAASAKAEEELIASGEMAPDVSLTVSTLREGQSCSSSLTIPRAISFVVDFNAPESESSPEGDQHSLSCTQVATSSALQILNQADVELQASQEADVHTSAPYIYADSCIVQTLSYVQSCLDERKEGEEAFGQSALLEIPHPDALKELSKSCLTPSTSFDREEKGMDDTDWVFLSSSESLDRDDLPTVEKDLIATLTLDKMSAERTEPTRSDVASSEQQSEEEDSSPLRSYASVRLRSVHSSLDNVSDSASLREFERLEKEVRERTQSLSSSDTDLASKAKRRSSNTSINSLAEFERLEQELEENGKCAAPAPNGEQPPPDVMVLSDIKEESESEDVSQCFGDQEGRSDQALSECGTTTPEHQEYGDAMATSVDSLDAGSPCYCQPGAEVHVTVEKVARVEGGEEEPVSKKLLGDFPLSDPDSLIASSYSELSADELEAQRVVEKASTTMCDASTSFQEYGDEGERDSLSGDQEPLTTPVAESAPFILSTALRSGAQVVGGSSGGGGGDDDFPMTITRFETSHALDDGSLEVITRTVSTRVVDSVSTRIRFSEFESPAGDDRSTAGSYSEFTSTDEMGNVTRTVVRRISPTEISGDSHPVEILSPTRAYGDDVNPFALETGALPSRGSRSADGVGENGAYHERLGEHWSREGHQFNWESARGSESILRRRNDAHRGAEQKSPYSDGSADSLNSNA